MLGSKPAIVINQSLSFKFTHGYMILAFPTEQRASADYKDSDPHLLTSKNVK